MNLKRTKRTIGSVFLLISTVFSCIDSDGFDTDKISSDLGIDDVGLMLKLATAKVTVGDMFPAATDTIQYYTDEQGNERILFYLENEEVVSYGLKDAARLDNIPSQTVLVPFVGTANTITTNLEVPLSTEDVSIQLIDADLELNIQYTGMLAPIHIDLVFPSSGSMPNTLSLAVSEGSGSLSQVTRQQLNVNADGNFPMQVIVSSPVGVSSSQLGKLEISFARPTMYHFKGVVNQILLPIPEEKYSFDFGQLEDFSQGIKFFDPRVLLPIADNIGLSGSADVEVVAKMNDASVIAIEVPELLTFEAGKDTLKIDSSNSNITELTDGSALPRDILVDGKVYLSSNESAIEMDENSKFSVGCIIQIPMDMSINSSYNVDTIELNSSTTDELSAATLLIQSTSKLPVTATVTLGMYDEDTETTIDYVEANLINAAPVGIDGIVTAAIEGNKEIVLTAEELKNLGKSEKLIVNVKLVSTDFEKNQRVVLLTDYNLDFEVSIKGKLRVD